MGIGICMISIVLYYHGFRKTGMNGKSWSEMRLRRASSIDGRWVHSDNVDSHAWSERTAGRVNGTNKV